MLLVKRETAGRRNSQTDTRLSRRNKHAEKSHPAQKYVSGNDTVETPSLPFLTGPKEELGGTDQTVHAIFRAGVLIDHSSPLRLSTWGQVREGRLLYCGALNQEG